ncbi:hypothetical protein DO97_07420 [Neosynechococcus sphagnicola sy1]|uniref:DUF2721 domain-containing protein n=1 Tax=Neosynechococcus sphagnicola sy1 TaxID=1497020 RepID=A0A098TP59_9CYAN|nr:DUF2721 domain-containing protein [Neosynechococcus sphagnicola]KGF72603.1 hypothetical protein DO97_07420 [Neosynechococcus sphagnicola sy1]
MDDSSTSTLIVIKDLILPTTMLMSQALFLLGLGGRRALLFNNISALEKKRVVLQTAEQRLKYADNTTDITLENISSLLLQKNRYVLLSIWSHIASIACFIFTSLAIGIDVYISNQLTHYLSWILFVIGLFFILSGIIMLGIEEWFSYRLIAAEIQASKLITTHLHHAMDQTDEMV